MLINEFGDNIRFSYQRDRKKSQMIFSYKIQSSDAIETLHNTDHVKECATLLRRM